MALPNFLIVGAPKAGTTSLARLLANHPDVFFSRPKETRFFSRNYYRGIEYYEQTFFAGARNRLAGEGDVTYLSHPCAPQRIARDLPAVKIIAVLRNPVSRFWSGYLMGVQEGRFSASPEEIMETNLRQLEEYRCLWAGIGDEAYDHIAWHSELLQNGNYADCLRNYLGVFDRGRVLVLIFEELLANPRTHLKRIYEFLQIDDHGRLSLPHANAYVPGDVPRFLTKPSVRRLLPKRVEQRLFRSPVPSAELNRKLRSYYAAQISQTEELLGRSLCVWEKTAPPGPLTP